ncbi:NUDIX domain-containing protein [Gulosibacter macacae]|uniref:NUDIX domain-containing protein n=1 Tax=Gulosibacter macacae TaxID=2488791 RepID=A0A3P3VX50_9MICO|nr:NUDIX domain-containing protein [Gulosibacter macacae]RRJ86618.1 NUDIX domain-containing protein [Gulosibacter macacae]
MPVPEFVLLLRAKIGHDPLWLIGCTAIVVRPHAADAASREDALAAVATISSATAARAPRVGTRAIAPEVWSADGAAPEDILLVRRSDDGLWAPVTGVVDPGEHPAVAAVRETLEEARIEAVVERLVQVHVTDEVTHPNGDIAQYTGLVFRCRYLAGEAGVGDDESTDARWWPASSLPPMREVHRDAIRAALGNDPLCELRDGDDVIPVVAP